MEHYLPPSNTISVLVDFSIIDVSVDESKMAFLTKNLFLFYFFDKYENVIIFRHLDINRYVH